MPNGDVHAAVSQPITYTLAVAGLGLALLHPPAIVLGVGAWVGEHITPDIDHHMVTREERKIIRWNKFIGWLWHLYWTPYQKRNPHRGAAHTWPRGTVERFLLALWPFLVLSVGLVILEPDLLSIVAWCWLYVFLGQSAQDCVHIAMDTISTRWRRRLRAK